MFSRRWKAVENRVKLVEADQYAEIPSDPIFGRLLSSEVLKKDQNTRKTNIISIKSAQTLWPVVYLERFGVFVVAVPMIEGELQEIGLAEKPNDAEKLNRNAETVNVHWKQHSLSLPLINLPFITATLTFLEDIMPLVESYAPHFDAVKLLEFNSYLTLIVPLGKPIDTNVSNIRQLLKQNFPPTEMFVEKRPAWKPFLYRERPNVDFSLVEEISAIQYDSPKIPNVWKVTGSVSCQVDVEGLPEVSVVLRKEKSHIQLTSICIHPNVQNSDFFDTLKFTFCPPLHRFVLCHYAATNISKLPLRGYYQMKESSSNEVKILVQLKLDEEVNNDFEYCHVDIPFPNRGKIISLDALPTAGTVTVNPSRENALRWNIGNKFTSRNLEVALPATICFEKSSNDNSPTQLEDPFCVGTNAYISINFKVNDWTLSGLNIDKKQFAISPKTANNQLTVSRRLVSGEYLIWNSWGKARYSISPSLDDPHAVTSVSLEQNMNTTTATITATNNANTNANNSQT